jgi:hypothetical protein
MNLHSLIYIRRILIFSFVKKKQSLTIEKEKDKMESTVLNGKKRIKIPKKKNEKISERKKKEDLKFKLALIFVHLFLLLMRVEFY